MQGQMTVDFFLSRLINLMGADTTLQQAREGLKGKDVIIQDDARLLAKVAQMGKVQEVQDARPTEAPRDEGPIPEENGSETEEEAEALESEEGTPTEG